MDAPSATNHVPVCVLGEQRRVVGRSEYSEVPTSASGWAVTAAKRHFPGRAHHVGSGTDWPRSCNIECSRHHLVSRHAGRTLDTGHTLRACAVPTNGLPAAWAGRVLSGV